MSRSGDGVRSASRRRPVASGAPAPLAIDVPARNAAIDHETLRADRLARIRAELVRRDYGAALFSDPINIRYATGARNMAVWTMHAPGRYVFVPVDGPVVLFEFAGSKHLSRELDTVDELRDAISSFYFLAGPRVAEMADRWSREIIALTLAHAGPDRRLAVDRCEPWLARHLEDAGINLFDAQEPAEVARMIKTPEELDCMQLAMDVCDVAVDRIREALRPGITENQLWAVLHETNIAHDGEWIECRLLSSGPRTNPWFQESGNRVIEAGDLVGFDTDMVGPNGYLADISRTMVCPGRSATADQRRLYEIAHEQILTNIDVLRAGMSLREFSEQCWPVPEQFHPNRYMMMVHGAGMVDEAPSIAYAVDFAEWGYDGMIEENMVLCVESYIGEVGGAQGVKLEQQVLITSSGAVAMSRSPLVDTITP
jgi:Xaa-Pro aminopeptidase